MEPLNITIILIFIALAMTTVGLLGNRTLPTKLLIFSLALLSSSGVIYQTFRDELRYTNAFSMLEQLVIASSSLPPGFEERLEMAAEFIATQEGYSSSTLRPREKWQSENFGYLIGFFNPPDNKPRIGYEENDIGFEHGFVYVSKSSAYKLVIEFSKGNNIESVLKNEAFWKWEKIDLSDNRFLLSVNAIVTMAYRVAVEGHSYMVSKNPKYDFQQNPQKYRAEVRFQDGDKYIEVILTSDNCNLRPNNCRCAVAKANQDFLRQLVNVDPITRGGRIFYYFYNLFLKEWDSNNFRLVCYMR